jgi:hypothetical protein
MNKSEAYNKWYFSAKNKMPNGTVAPIGTALIYTGSDEVKLDILEKAFNAGWEANSKGAGDKA